MFSRTCAEKEDASLKTAACPVVLTDSRSIIKWFRCRFDCARLLSVFLIPVCILNLFRCPIIHTFLSNVSRRVIRTCRKLQSNAYIDERHAK